MKRILSLSAAAFLSLTLLAGCGDDTGDGGSASRGGSGDYCDDLKAAKSSLDGVENNDLSGLDKAVDQFHKLRDEAPDEIADDWKVLSEGFDSILAAFEKAGLDTDDLAAMQNGEMPEGVDPQALQDALSEIQGISGDKFEAASDNIAKHAKDECGIDLEG